MTERLQKIIAQAGIASRRAAEQLILDGRVRVNGEVVLELGTRANARTDRVEIDGMGELHAEPLVYLAVFKPEHVISTVDDPEGRSTVVELLQQSRSLGPRAHEGNMPRVYPIGRLDFDAEGLILLTNDGTLTQALLHPRHHVPKTYMVKVRGVPDDRALARLRNGLRLRNEDGTWSRPTAPAEVEVVKQNNNNSWLEMTIFEGRNHQVKRMCEAVGHFCIRLVRTHFAGIELGEMPPGGWRFLTPLELKALKAWPLKGSASGSAGRSSSGSAGRSSAGRSSSGSAGRSSAGRSSSGSAGPSSSGSAGRSSAGRSSSGSAGRGSAGRSAFGSGDKPLRSGSERSGATSRPSARSAPRASAAKPARSGSVAGATKPGARAAHARKASGQRTTASTPRRGAGRTASPRGRK